jgi:hypothetical protein
VAAGNTFYGVDNGVFQEGTVVLVCCREFLEQGCCNIALSSRLSAVYDEILTWRSSRLDKNVACQSRYNKISMRRRATDMEKRSQGFDLRLSARICLRQA